MSAKEKLGSLSKINLQIEDDFEEVSKLKMSIPKIYDYEVTSKTYTQYYSEGVKYRLRKLDQYLNINRIQILSETNYPENLIQFKINDSIFLTDDREIEKLIEFLKFLHNK